MSDDRYARVIFRGHTVNRWTMAALLACEADLGYELTIMQGSYHRGVGASAGTHDGGGAVDLTPYDHERKVLVLRRRGFAAFRRLAIPGLWPEHVHAILIGDTDATQVAQNQVTAYYAGYDGLGHLGRGGRDNGPRVAIRQFPYPPPPPPKEENSMANFTEADLRKIVREESDKSVRKYMAETVDHPTPDNPKNTIWVSTALGMILRKVSK